MAAGPGLRMREVGKAPRKSPETSRARVGRSVENRVTKQGEAGIELESLRVADPSVRSRIRSVVRFVVLTLRWIAVAVALLLWLVVVPLVDLLWALLSWVARRVSLLLRRLPW